MLKQIQSFIWKRRAFSHLIRVEKYLRGFEIRIKSLKNVKQTFELYRRKITTEDVQGVLANYETLVAYFKGDKPYACDPKASRFLDKSKHSIDSIEIYSRIKQLFERQRKAYFEEVESLHSQVTKINEHFESSFQMVELFFVRVQQLRSSYITHSSLNKVLQEFSAAFKYFNVKDAINILDQAQEFIGLYSNFESKIKEWNKEYLQNELDLYCLYFDNIDGKALDSQQRIAVITDEDNNLILAGAGSGKTLTISGKVKYLVELKGIKPHEILLISFTRKAADEMFERISHKLGVPVTVKTFHKLGLEIISEYNSSKPDVPDDNYMGQIISKYLKTELMENDMQLRSIIEFFGYYLNVPKGYQDFETLGDYHDYHKNVDFETLKGKVTKPQYTEMATNSLAKQKQTLNGETVKSYEETLIANFLFLNGVSYVYEQQYPFDTSDETHRQYKPDFYLPDYDIYIEHFGVDEKMQTPWLSPIEEQKYVDGMVWKRGVHQQHQTKLIETYSYYSNQGVLLDKLREKLLASRVSFKEVNYHDIFSAIYKQTEDRYFKEFVKLITTFVSLFKSSGYAESQFDDFVMANKNSAEGIFLKRRTDLFLQVVRPIYQFYEASLKQQKMIDFNDMINQATTIVNNGGLQFNHKYIIIDEYQDISQSRFKLIQAIKHHTDAKVMCVGDDWQSIYRFAGSDLELFTKFEKYFGFHKLMKIERTYRNSQQLIDIAGKFVMKNPSQFKKNLKSDKRNEKPIQILGYQENSVGALKHALQEIVSSFGEETEIMLLGRNKFDINFIEGDPLFEKKYIDAERIVRVFYKRYPKLNMYFLTSHKSKGLEADNVIIVNAKNSLLGFPNKISDDPVLSLVLTDQDKFSFAEERRLFYVAITRTKNTTYILAPDTNQSVFVKELTEHHQVPYQMVTAEVSIKNNPKCPKCSTGQLVIRNGKGTAFLGCTNYPGCNYSVKYLEVLQSKKNCRRCGGFMVLKKGPYGKFYGCTNYPRCENKEKHAK